MGMPLLDDKTIQNIVLNAELLDVDCFDVLHLQLDNAKELVMVAITGEYLDPVATVLEAVRDLREAK